MTNRGFYVHLVQSILGKLLVVAIGNTGTIPSNTQRTLSALDSTPDSERDEETESDGGISTRRS